MKYVLPKKEIKEQRSFILELKKLTFDDVCILILIMYIVIAVIAATNQCFAQDETALALAQCIVAECNHCDNDMKEPIATAWVIYKRMIAYNNNKYNKHKRSFKEQIYAYCAIFDDGARKNYNGPKQIKRRKEILIS